MRWKRIATKRSGNAWGPIGIYALRGLTTCFLLLSLTGCMAALQRVEFNAAEQAAAEVPGLEGARRWADTPMGADFGRWLPRSRHITMLALSGGADSGAYGAGFLNGWSATGARPVFSVVSGVSTGALIAPFAFLGSEYDPVLHKLYTETAAGDIFTARPLLAGLAGPSFADTGPLRHRIEKLVTPELLAAIGREHEKGRRLFVVTANLDAQRAVIWNMGEIAASRDPASADVFRRVLLASAAIPGIFPPVLIGVTAGGRHFNEMHADGGTITQILTVTEPLLVGAAALPRGRSISLYALINKTYEPEFNVVKNNSLSIIERGFSTIIKSNTRNSIISTYNFAKNKNILFRFTYIGSDFEPRDGRPFDRGGMRALYEYGYRRGAGDAPWHSAPQIVQHLDRR